MNPNLHFIESTVFEFRRYKTLGEGTFNQLSEIEMHWKSNPEDNSIALIIKHLWGNMRSRWTNFLTEDGEKSWRNRETEFLSPPQSKKELLHLWEEGWQCLFNSLENLEDSDFEKPIKIRNQELTIMQALSRQLAHYSYHVGQIVYLGKTIKGNAWVSLSIPKGESQSFNHRLFKGEA